MSKVIPILPCTSIQEQCAFYESIGFTIIAKYISPNPYAVVQHDDIVLHFWGSKRHEPLANASMVFIEVEDVDTLNAAFCQSIKKASGKIPRTGLPRITKVRALKDDNRFTLCDPAGNTFYFGTPNHGEAIPMRTLDSAQHQKTFAAVYDLLHSHENAEKAAKGLSVLMRSQDELNDADKAKLAALASEIEKALTACSYGASSPLDSRDTRATIEE